MDRVRHLAPTRDHPSPGERAPRPCPPAGVPKVAEGWNLPIGFHAENRRAWQAKTLVVASPVHSPISANKRTLRISGWGGGLSWWYNLGMIWNVVDRRKRPFRWAKINAIIEATWHDNTVADSDTARPTSMHTEVTYDAQEGISLNGQTIRPAP
jgi:hypothetical protein